MSEHNSMWTTVFGSAAAIVIAVVGWHNRRIDKLSEKVNACQTDHVKLEEFNKKVDKLEASIIDLGKEMKSDFNRLYDRLDERK